MKDGVGAPPAAPLRTWAILLRGVTPTGRNRVPMADLRIALAAAGLADVRTWIQSGNVVARSALDREALAALVHAVIARDIGADLAVIVRTHAELRRMLDVNPYPVSAAARTYFTLLASPPAPARVAAFAQLATAPDTVRLIDDSVYTLYATKLSDSKFTNNLFERKLGVAATTRNFNTLSHLVELSA